MGMLDVQMLGPCNPMSNQWPNMSKMTFCHDVRKQVHLLSEKGGDSVFNHMFSDAFE